MKKSILLTWKHIFWALDGWVSRLDDQLLDIMSFQQRQGIIRFNEYFFYGWKNVF